MHLFSNRSETTSKYSSKNKKVAHKQATKHVTDVLKPHFQVFVIYIPEQIRKDMKSLF